MKAINLAEKLGSFDDIWRPKVVGELNGQLVKLVKCQGEYIWHAHEHEDEMFLVLDGRLEVHFRERTILLRPGEYCIVPRGVEHKPVAPQATAVLLFEPAATRSTGDVDHQYTVESDDLEHI